MYNFTVNQSCFRLVDLPWGILSVPASPEASPPARDRRQLALHEEHGLAEQRQGRRPGGRPTGQASAAVDIFTEKTVETALVSQASRAVGHVKRLRRADPNLSRDDLLKALEDRFYRATRRSGRAAGAAVSSGTASAISGTRKDTLEAAVFYVLAATEAYEIPLSELDYREGVVRAVLLAKKADWLVNLLASKTAPHWAGKFVAWLPEPATRRIGRINDVMGPEFVTEQGQGGIVLEKVVEREVGSAFGWLTNTTFAWHVIRVTKGALNDLENDLAIDGDIVGEDDGEPDDMGSGTPGPIGRSG